MNMQSVQMVNLSIPDLIGLITKCLKTELEKVNLINSSDLSEPKNDLLSRKEVSEMLGVSFTTLFHWNNEGILPAQKIGNRVYYQRCLIMDKLNNVS